MGKPYNEKRKAPGEGRLERMRYAQKRSKDVYVFVSKSLGLDEQPSKKPA